jgi:hypothetical protein
MASAWRLPLYHQLTDEQQDFVVSSIQSSMSIAAAR